MPNIQLGKNLRTLRKRYKLSQQDMSVMLNISRQAYSNYENHTRTPDLGTLLRISDIFSVTLDELVTQNIGNTIAKTKGPYHCGLNIHTQDSIYMTTEELKLVIKYRDLTEDDRRILTSFVDQNAILRDNPKGTEKTI